MIDQPVSYDVNDGRATITLNRPEAMNSLDIATKEALLAAVRQAASDPDVRCVVLTGTGRAFCVGQDLKEHIALLSDDPEGALSSTVDSHYNPIVTTLATMPKPVIAALNGVAAGAGASLAFACDFRILVDTASFNLAFTGVALSCDTGSSWTLQRLVGRAKAIEMLYFPTTVSAADALALGIATTVVPADDFEATVCRAREPVGKRADGFLRLDPAVGGVRGRAQLRGRPRNRVADDGEDRSHPGPSQCRGGLHRQGEAEVRRPLARAAERAQELAGCPDPHPVPARVGADGHTAEVR